MQIETLNIISFGRLSDREITLSPNVNVLEGDNESGKSTVTAFIKFILYGMKDHAERHQYISWSGAAASGSMTVLTTNGVRIKIERTLAVDTATNTARESVRMTDLDTGLQLHKGKCPGEVLFGAPEDVFTGTALVRQIGGTALDGAKMSAAAENLLFSADEAINTKKAADKLDAVTVTTQLKWSRILLICAAVCLAVGIVSMFNRTLVGYGFEAIFFLALMLGVLAFYLRSNAKDKVQDPHAVGIDLSLFRTDKAFNIGAIGVIVILTILYIALW